MGFVEQIVSPVISTYAKGDRLTNQSAIQCLCGFTAFHSHVSRIWLRNYSLSDFETTDIDDETKQGLIQVILYSIVRNRLSIDKIKREVNL